MTIHARKTSMIFPKSFKKIALAFLLPVSITNLPADTNLSGTNTEQTTVNQTDSAPINPAVLQCRTFAESLESIIVMIFNIKSGEGKRLFEAVTPLLIQCTSIKELPETATPEHVYQALLSLNQSVHHLNQILDKGAQNVDDFAPPSTAKDAVSDQDLQMAHAQLDAAFGLLISKVDESYQDVWRNLRMHVNNQLNKLDTILQAINTNINNNESIVGKDEIKKDIMDLRTTLRQIQKEFAAAGPNPQVILGVYQVNKAIISYLQDCQKHKFRKWALVDLASALSRKSEDVDQTLDELLFEMYHTNGQLEKLEKDAEKIDLTVVNHTARFVGDYVIDPIQRHNLILWGIAGVGTLGLAAYTAYYFDNKFFSSPLSKFRETFGFPDHSMAQTIKLEEKAISAYATAMSRTLHRKAAELNISVDDLLKDMQQDALSIIANPNDHRASLDDLHTIDALRNIVAQQVQEGKLPIRRIDRFIYEHKSGTAAIGISLMGLAMYSYYQLWKKYEETWTKKMYVWFARMKGGSYAKTAEKYDEILPTITFDDVIGLEHEKSLVYPHLKYIKDPESWDANELTPPTGILLTGDTRTGKTFFAKAICGELHKQNPDKGIKFITIDAHDIKAEGIAMWLRVAKVMAPCVVFIDEIDLLNLQRTGERTLLADFLQAMSGVADKDPKKQVIVIGTTNKPENLDHALRQSGRFALTIPFSYPNVHDRITFINKRLDKFAIDPKAFDINVTQLAYETHGKSFEDLKLMIDSAFIRTTIKGEAISQEHIEWGLDTQLHQIKDIDTKQVSADEKRIVAAHFAGEALSHMLLDLDEKIAKVTTRERVVRVKEESVYDQYYAEHKKQKSIEQGGLFTYLEHDTLDIKSTDELAKKAKTFLAARIAERLITNTSSTLFGHKKNAAFNMIKTIVADGIDVKSLSKQGQNQISDETQMKLKAFEQEMEQLLLQHKDALIALTNALEEKQILTYSQLKKVVDTIENLENQNMQDLSNTIPDPA